MNTANTSRSPFSGQREALQCSRAQPEAEDQGRHDVASRQRDDDRDKSGHQRYPSRQDAQCGTGGLPARLRADRETAGVLDDDVVEFGLPAVVRHRVMHGIADAQGHVRAGFCAADDDLDRYRCEPYFRRLDVDGLRRDGPGKDS